MPGPSRWMIRASLVYLIAGIVTGALMLVHKAIPLYSGLWLLLPVHIEIVIFGWIIQLTMGTGYWILPRYLEGPPRGNRRLAWMMPVVYNAGILAVICSRFGLLTGFWATGGRVLEVLGVVLFITLHWKRIVSYRKSPT